MTKFAKQTTVAPEKSRAEIERLQAEVTRLMAEQDAISVAIGTNEYMDPPDGGDVSLAEQVRRMRDALLARVAAAEQDAARYRHWRNLSGPVPHCFIRLSGAELDAAIDAAMESGK